VNRKHKIFRSLFFFIFFLFAAIGTEYYVLSDQFSNHTVKLFEKQFHYKENKANNAIKEVVSILDKKDSLSDLKSYADFEFLRQIFLNDEISFSIFKNGELFFWTDNVIRFEKNIDNKFPKLVKHSNCYSYQLRDSINNYEIYCSIILKYNYKIQNNYLINRFAKNFELPNDFDFTDKNSSGSYSIVDSNGDFAFAIKHNGETPCVYYRIIVPIICYILYFLFLIISIYRIRFKFIKGKTSIVSLFAAPIFVGLYSLMNYFQVPRSLFMLQLFSAQFFAFTSFWPSLGEFLIFAFLLLLWSSIFGNTFSLKLDAVKNSKRTVLYFIVSLIFSALYFVFVRFLIYSLVMNSSFSFSVYEVEDFSINTILGYLVIGFLLLSFLLVVFRIGHVFQRSLSTRKFFSILFLTSLIIYLIFNFIIRSEYARFSVFFPLIICIGYFLNQKAFLSHKLSIIVLIVIACTIHAEITVIQFVRLHENKIQETMALNLSAEHDPNAELFLHDIDSDLKNDSNLISYIDKPFELVEKYITKKYFGGYFRDYDLQLTLCNRDQNLIIQPENISRPCIEFFDEMLQKNGSVLTGTNFYFMENSTGRITYIGKYEFTSKTTHLPVNLFIELNSKLLSEGIGFPELLLPKNSLGTRLRNNFSYAKYSNGELVDRGGEYNY